MLNQRNRFHGRGGIRYTLRSGGLIRNHFLTVKYTFHPHRENPRAAIVISKKVAKSAVVRNRIRRRLYECIRLQLPNLPKRIDLVVIVGSAEVNFCSNDELTRLVVDALSQASLNNTSEK